MTKQNHWETRLHEHIGAVKDRPFTYGTHDCATFGINDHPPKRSN